MLLGTEVSLGLRDIVFDVDPATPRKTGTPTSTQFLAHVYSGQMAGWMKTPLGTEVELGPSRIVLDGVPGPPKGAQQPPPLFSAHVYCGHGRPSQLLLSSCIAAYKVPVITARCTLVQSTLLSSCLSVRPSVCLFVKFVYVF